MKKCKSLVLLILVTMAVCLITHSDSFGAGQLKISGIGPNVVKVGVGFNLQKDGSSAMWAKTENATKDTVIFWGNSKLKSVFANPNLVTAIVPKELFSKPGTFKIYVLDQKNNQKSNSVTLVVQ